VGAIHAESGMESQIGGQKPGTADALLGAMTNPHVATASANNNRTSEVPPG
jgi:hypothetical protein